MTLDRVGSDVGVDLHTLAQVKQRAPRARVFGAGGVRDAADLAQAEQAGAAGWLVASALHAGQLAIGHGVRATPTSRLR
jgi:phosphoribosylformimino-5-aminoimidazole carboxamide ribotide isomerase